MADAKTKNGLDKLYHRIEAVIATALIDAALKRMWAVTVNNGEEDEITKSTDRQAILNAMSTTDDETLTFHDRDTYMGWIRLVYGNDQDIISDYSIPIADGAPRPMETLVNEVSAALGIG